MRKLGVKISLDIKPLPSIVEDLIYCSNHHPVFTVSKGFSVRLLEKKFPDYRRIIPETYAHHFTFNRQELEEALKLIVVLTRDRFRGWSSP